MTSPADAGDASGGSIFAQKKAMVEAAFGGPGAFRFARWRRPIVPVVFGVDDATLALIKGGIEAVVAAAGHKMAETDPEMGANLFVFFLRDWDELAGAEDLSGLVGPLAPLAARLRQAGAARYVTHRFEADGAIRAAVVLERVSGDEDAAELTLAIAVRMLLSWAPGAPPPVAAGAVTAQVAALIRAAYDPVMPAATDDVAQALRLAARMT